jgi:hypothetical protein
MSSPIYYPLTVTVFFLWGALSDERMVCLLYMLLVLASVVFLGSESLGTRDHILLSQIWDFPFRRLLRLAGSRWRYLTPPHVKVKVKVMLGPTVSRPVSLCVTHPPGVYDQILIAVRPLPVCWCGALSLTRGRVCRLQLLLVLASAVILGSESRGTRDHILLSRIWDSPNLEGQVPVFISPRNRVAQLYPQALGSLSVASTPLTCPNCPPYDHFARTE